MSLLKFTSYLFYSYLKNDFFSGHNSVLQIPGTDEWRIVYHRISHLYGIKKPYPDIYREVCIDNLDFNADGIIKQVKPTL